MNRLFASTVARLVAAIFILQIMSSAAAIVLLRQQMLQVIRDDRVRQVLDVRDDLLASYYEGGRAGLVRMVDERRGGVSDPLIFVAVTGGGQNEVLSHLVQLPAVASTTRPEPTRIVHASDAEAVDGIAIANDLSDGTRLIVGAVTTPDRRVDTAFAEALSLTFVLTGALSFLGALVIGFVISRGTHAIAETADALGRGNFAARIDREDTGDGFDHLRRQINAMAERIDRLVVELQSVSGTLAHDLRSPIARLRASIDTALATTPEGPASDALTLARSDAEALDAMLVNALELSRLESGTIEDRRKPLDLGEIAADLTELYEPLAEQSGIELRCDAQAAVSPVDRELLSRALANLVDNAIKYGGRHILVGTRREGGDAVLWVSDDGPGIAPEDRARAIDRFTRLDNARTRPGAGLGLAMVAAVARLHGGRLELSGVDGSSGGGLGLGGLMARIVLPGG